MNKFKLVPLGLACLMLTSQPAQAATDTGKVIIQLGVQIGVAYLDFSTSNPMLPNNSLSYTCPGDKAFIDTSTDDGKRLLQVAIAARQNNMILTRIDYNPDPSGNCYITLIEF